MTNWNTLLPSSHLYPLIPGPAMMASSIKPSFTAAPKEDPSHVFSQPCLEISQHLSIFSVFAYTPALLQSTCTPGPVSTESPDNTLHHCSAQMLQLTQRKSQSPCKVYRVLCDLTTLSFPWAPFHNSHPHLLCSCHSGPLVFLEVTIIIPHPGALEPALLC